MPTLELSFIDSLAEPPFFHCSGQSVRFTGQPNLTRGGKDEFHHPNNFPLPVEARSCRDQYRHLFALDEG
jgi:hypothetical protein